MKHAATTTLGTVFSNSTSDLCCFFFAGEFSALFTCALCLLGSVVVGQCSGLRHDCLIRMQRAETRRSWEERASAHQWEQRASAPDSSSDEADIEDRTRDDAGEALGELLVHLHIQRVLSAKQFSIICWWAAKAGAVGPMNAYALGPNSQTGAYQRHVDRCLGLDKSADDSYLFQAPGYDKFDVSRSVHDIPVALPREALHDELTGTPQVLDELQSMVDRDALPPTYSTHPVVAAAHGAAVVPLAFYCDGAPFAKRDGFLAFWIPNLISGSRTFACVLRKSSLCQCGCRGYCTLYPVLNVLRWSIGVMATGYFPTARHDGSSWHSTDRSQSRRGALAATAAVIYIKGDWMEYVTTLSFTSWTHNVHPCPMCFCSPDTMHP